MKGCRDRGGHPAKRSRAGRLLGLLLLLLGGALHPVAAQGVSIDPTALTLTLQAPQASLSVGNRSDRPARFRVQIIHFRMTGAGAIMRVADGGATSAEPFLRYAPRLLEIPANTTRELRVIADLSQLRPGVEYRAHLQISPLPDPSTGPGLAATPGAGDRTAASAAPPGQTAAGGAAPGAVAIQITPTISTSVPVFLRAGEVAAQVALGAASVRGRILTVEVLQQGQASAAGTLQVLDGTRDLAAPHQVVIYPEIEQITARIPLSAVPTPGRPLTLRLIGQRGDAGRVLAEGQLVP